MPTPEQWDEIVAILENDCEIAGTYIDATGKTCAIGALALVAGVEAAALTNNQIAIRYLGIGVPIQQRFGLDREQLVDIQLTNDSHKDAAKRRAAVLAKVAELRGAAAES